MQAATTASIKADLKLLFSKTLSADIVVPPGEVTLFLSSAVVKLVSFIKLTDPKIISITSSSESCFCNPPLKPPSLKASMIKAIIAGPVDVKAKKYRVNVHLIRKFYSIYQITFL